MQQSLNPRGWKDILDTMSAQVAKLRVGKIIRNVSEVLHSNRYTSDVHFPDSRVRTSNVRIFIGSYPDNK